MPGPPLGETLHRGLDQAYPDALIPEVGAYGQRSEEPHAAPVGREVRTHQLAVDLRGEGRSRIGLPTRPHVARITQEHQRVGQTKKRAKSQPEDAIRLLKLVLFEWTNGDARPCLVNHRRLLPPALFKRVLSRPALKSLDSLSNGAYPRSLGFSECYGGGLVRQLTCTS